MPLLRQWVKGVWILLKPEVWSYEGANLTKINVILEGVWDGLIC